MIMQLLQRLKAWFLPMLFGLSIGAAVGYLTSNYVHVRDNITRGLLFQVIAQEANDSGNSELAVAYYNRTIGFINTWYGPHLSLGFLYESLGKPELALSEFQEALKLACSGGAPWGQAATDVDIPIIERKISELTEHLSETGVISERTPI